MTQIPAGWYPDPAPAPAGDAPQHRYWDGQQWTEHVQPAAPPVAPAPQAADSQPADPYDAPTTSPYPGQPAAYDGRYAQQPGRYGGHQPGQYGTQPTGQYGAPYPVQHGGQPDGVARTPDGQRLAGWWRRVVAYLLDAILVGAVSTLVGWSFASRIFEVYRDYIDQAIRAGENGTTAPSQADLLSQVSGAMAGFTLVTILVSLVYNVVFLKTLAATPAKLALGMRVRLRERPGPLTWGTILLRWLTQNVATLLNVVPGIGAVATLYSLLDGLWPLWDGNKQALHDKAARTNVVRLRG